jgi:hypothetical protein
MGRTGHVMAAWRHYHHDIDITSSLETPFEGAYRNPLESLGNYSERLGREITRDDYLELLASTKGGSYPLGGR